MALKYKLILTVLCVAFFLVVSYGVSLQWPLYLAALVVIFIYIKNINLKFACGILIVTAILEAITSGLIKKYLINNDTVTVLLMNNFTYLSELILLFISYMLIKNRWVIMLRLGELIRDKQNSLISKSSPCHSDAPILTVYLLFIVTTFLTFIEHLLMHSGTFGFSESFYGFFREHYVFYDLWPIVSALCRGAIVAILIGSQFIYDNQTKSATTA